MRKTHDSVRMIVVLAAITIIVSGLLGWVNAVTEDRIGEIEINTRNNAMRQVMPEGETFEEISLSEGEAGSVSAIYRAVSGGETAGYAVYAIPKGFGGDIEMMVGVDLAGKVTGVAITSMSETAGMGAKAEEPDFLSQYEGKIPDIGVSKTTPGDNEIAAITGATITSKAVTQGVNDALAAVTAIG